MPVTNKDLYDELTKLRRELEEADKELEGKIDKTYVKLVEYEPVRKIVYGLVGAVLLAFISAISTIALRTNT